jgi:hypothetical protein
MLKKAFKQPSTWFATLAMLLLGFSLFAQVQLPYNLTAGTPARAGDVMGNLTALRDGINALQAELVGDFSGATCNTGDVLTWSGTAYDCAPQVEPPKPAVRAAHNFSTSIPGPTGGLTTVLSDTYTAPSDGRLLVQASYNIIHSNADTNNRVADCIIGLTLDSSVGPANPARTVTVWPGVGTTGYGNGAVSEVFDVTKGVAKTVYLQARSDNDSKAVTVQRTAMTLTFIPN